MNFPPHKGGLYLTHNEHKSYYESVAQWLKTKDSLSFQSEASRAVAIETNECWTLQWYPETPVGFLLVAAPTLEELLEFASTVK